MPLGSMLTSACCLLFLLTCSHCSKNSTDPPPGNNGPDTTSHNFVWQIDTLGDLTSFLNDVSAINKNDIWVGGYIRKNDTTFNALHWNGQEWEWLRIAYATSLGVRAVVNTNSVLALSSDEVWSYSQAGSYAFWDGNNWQTEYVFNERRGTIWKIYKHYSGKLLFVGSDGNITTFENNVWYLETNVPTTDLLDIGGSNSHPFMWACGYSTGGNESILLFYDGTSWQTHWQWNNQTGSTDSTFDGLLGSVWSFDPDSIMIVGSGGIYRMGIDGNSLSKRDDFFLPSFPRSVRGSAANNIFIVGSRGMVCHYNGRTWKSYPELRNESWILYSVAVLENIVVAVGADFSRGVQRDIIVTGRRP